MQSRYAAKKHITLKEWRQILSSSSPDKLYSDTFPAFVQYYADHNRFMTMAEATAFRMVGRQYEERVESFKKEHNL